MKLLSDENFHGDIVRGLFLREPNLDLVRIQDIGLRAVDDPSILDWAAANDRIVLTHDRATISKNPRFSVPLLLIWFSKQHQ